MTDTDFTDSQLASFGCMACHRLGYGTSPAEIHHIRRGGSKRGNAPRIPLCPAHHRQGGRGVAVHAGRESFEASIATEGELLELIPDIAAKPWLHL